MHSFPELVEDVARDMWGGQIWSLVQGDGGGETFEFVAQVKCVHGRWGAGHAYHPRAQNVPTAVVTFDTPVHWSQRPST